MSFSPSSRHNAELEEVAINLNPMMDMFAVLIPALLMLSAVVEVAIVEVSAPSIGAPTTPPPKPDEPPLNFVVTITEGGYMLTADQELPGVPLVAPNMVAPQIPLKEMGVVCSRFRGTVPPPRSRNLERPGCNDQNARDSVPFLVYDTETLNQAVQKIHQTYPNERNVIIAAESTVQYESIIDVLDATRVARTADGGMQTMFDQPVLRPAANL